MAGMAGFGPTDAGVKVPCLTAWLHPMVRCCFAYKSKFNAVIISHLLFCVNTFVH